MLPVMGWRDWWDRIHVDPQTKQRLFSYADFCLRHRAEFSRVGLPVHGIALLYGPPGTGKSSLARGLANIVAEGFVADGTTDQVIFAEVDPHALPSQMLGESQRNTVNLLEKSLPELAAKGHPVIVVIDEVNSLAMRRSIAAGGRDPVDVMRATEAVLRGVDYLAAAAPNVLVLATSNFVATIDEALLDRVDIAVEIKLPDMDRVVEILEDTLSELPAVKISTAELVSVAEELVGRSGRDIRKFVLDVIVTRGKDHTEPLLATDLERVLEAHREHGDP